MKLYIRKIWSLNPTLHRAMELEKALKQYRIYIGNCILSSKVGHHINKEIKSFDEWCKTEI